LEFIVSIILKQITKRYGDFPVVNNISLTIENGELFVLLGSSGSGKSTVLNIIAGLTHADQGQVWLNGRDVTQLPTQQRQVGFVFQNYALFQHMNVGENVGFGLRVKKYPSNARAKRVEELLDMVGLAGLGSRLPHQLSGGQQQRVALARALAGNPQVLLLDEPLGALDAKIRLELRRNLRMVQKSLGIATILVTHDQEEAFDLADHIGIMNFGRLIEVGKPADLYQYPQTEFVASFLGTSNLMVGNVNADKLHLGTVQLNMPKAHLNQQLSNQRVQILFRPEDVMLHPSLPNLPNQTLGEGVVDELTFTGPYERIRVRLPAIPGVRVIVPPTPFGSHSFIIETTRTPEETQKYPLQLGDSVWVEVLRFHILEHAGLNILLLTSTHLRSQAILSSVGQLARIAHARLTLWAFESGNTEKLAVDSEFSQRARKQLGSGLAALQIHTDAQPPIRSGKTAIESQSYDLVVTSFSVKQDIMLLEMLISHGEQHILLLPTPTQLPNHVLLCVLPGEPAKSVISFTARLFRHFGTKITLLSVISDTTTQDDVHYAEEFLRKAVETLERHKLHAEFCIGRGDLLTCIAQTLKDKKCEWLVTGAHLPINGEAHQLGEILLGICEKFQEVPLLIVKSHFLLP
jgi:sulfate transport system ATP-binding protein